MDADLREIVVVQVPELLACLQALGVETCTDVKYMWKSAEAFCTAVEEFAQRRMAPNEAFGLAKAWTQACRVAAGMLDSQVQELVRIRQSSQRDLRRPAEPMLPPSDMAPKLRRMISTWGPSNYADHCSVGGNFTRGA